MALKVPVFKEEGLTKFLEDMVKHINDQDNLRLHKQTANNSIILQSSFTGGKTYEIKVNAAGVLVATLLAG